MTERTLIESQRGRRLETRRFDEEPTDLDLTAEDRAAQLAELPDDHEPNAPRVLL